MTRKNNLWSKISAPSVLVVLTALFAGLFIDRSFNPARPRNLTLHWDPVNVVGQSEGLITFDPLEQAYTKLGDARPWRAGTEERRKRFSIEHLVAELLGDQSKRKPEDRWLVLLESVRGGVLSEDHERRLRARIATALALVQEGYYPLHSKRLNLLWLDDPNGLAPAGGGFADPERAGVLIPYEFFTTTPSEEHAAPACYSRIVVCWIDEAAIERNPLEFALHFESVLSTAIASQHEAPDHVDLRWLGPTTSGRLKELLAGFAGLRNGKGEKSNLKIATPYATSPMVKLPGEGANGSMAVGNNTVDAEWKNPGISIRRAVNTDTVLARLLVAELMARVPALLPMNNEGDKTCASPCWLRRFAMPLRWLGLIPPYKQPSPVRVALITEQDSTYGQSWIKNLEGACQDLARPQEGPIHPQLLEKLQFTVFPVFGWVDALVRDTENSKDGSAATAVSPDYPAEAHQLDYLGRIRDELSAGGKFDAIGVFVTEEYDTMLILEALRPRFPGAIFFTTDLDARYLHPRHAPFTRNLVVASHFGLRPEKPCDAHKSGRSNLASQAAPHFRDGYQSGVYCAVQALARGLEPRAPEWAHIYEVGRTRVVELNTAARADRIEPKVFPRQDERTRVEALADALLGGRASPSNPAASCPNMEAPESAGPDRGRYYRWAFFSGCGVLFALLIIGVRPRPTRSRKHNADVRILLIFAIVLGFALALLALVEILADTEAPYYVAEPVYLLEGLSAWPTFGLRMLSTAVSVAALIWIEARLRSRIRAIELERPEIEDSKPVSLLWVLGWPLKARWSSLKALCMACFKPVQSDVKRTLRARLSSVLKSSAQPSMAHSMDELWAFLARSVRRPLRSLLCTFVCALLFFFALSPFFVLWPPPASPVRGESAYLLDRITLFASLFPFLMLLARVMVVSFFASRAIGRVVDADAIRITGQDSGIGSLSTLSSDRVRCAKERLECSKQIADAVEPITWGPMAVLGLMIGARASVFDAWPWPTVLMWVYAIFFAILLILVVSMMHQCKGARAAALNDLDREREKLADNESESRRLLTLRQEIEELQGGAFSPLLQHPLVGAILLPLGAFGANLAFERNFVERLLGAL